MSHFQKNVALIATIALLSISTAAIPKTTKPRFILILGLDGLSEQTMQKMYDGGYFREFHRPIPMVASFPSVSDPNWAHLMGAPVEPGYTKAHFELTKNADGSVGEEVGNVINHLTKPAQYEKYFDFKPEGVFQHLMSMTWQETSALYWTDSLTRILLEEKNIPASHVFKAFIVNTDFISHTSGEEKLMSYLKNLDKKLKNLKEKFEARHHAALEFVIVSDHGNYYEKPKAVSFEKTLSKSGFRLTKRLKNKNDYAFMASEIISFGAFFTLPGNENALAQKLSAIEGVHVALADNGKNHVSVYSKNGEAEIEIDPVKQLVSYKVLSGEDPFHQIQLFKNEKELSIQKYFYETLGTQYPNALVRAWEGFYKNASQPASVLVSPQLGHVFTNETLELLTALSGIHSSHGSFAREESLGVVISTMALKDEAMTTYEFQDYLKKLK